MAFSARNGREQCSSLISPTGGLVGDLADTSSLWYDLRLAEMSGYDYVFAPDAACRWLHSLSALENFLLNIETILNTKGSRTVLISYWHDRNQKCHFEKYRLEWADGIAISWHKELLDNSPQHDFIEMLYDHSEKLILER